MTLRLKHDIRGELDAPILLAGWPGMGNVGAAAIAYLRAGLSAKPLGEIDVSEYVAPESVVIENGLVKLPAPPSNQIYYHEDPALLFLESESQLNGDAALDVIREVLDFAEHHEVKAIYTAAAFALPVGRKQPVKVLGAANEETIRDRLIPAGVQYLEEGQITGLNGLLLGFAKLRGIPAACLLATMPQYAVNILNPKSSRAIIEVLQSLLGIEVDLTGLDSAVAKTEETMKQIEAHIRKALSEGEGPAEGESEEWKEVEEEEIPEKVMQKIERLFDEIKVTGSKDKGAELKRELDRWNLYKIYEDRFLDLYRDDEK